MPSLLRPRQLPVQTVPLSASSWDLLRAADASLDDADLVRAQSVRQLRRGINRVPRAQRGLDWLERVILIYVVKGERRSRCKALANRMHEARLAKGEAAAWADFEKRLKQAVDRHVLADSKFNFTFAFSDKPSVARELKRVVDAISALGHPVFVNSGTLLGAVRAQGFIAHDNDVDLAVMLRGDSNTEVLRSFYALYEQVRKLDGVALQYRSKVKRPVFKLSMESGVRIDIFPAYVLQGRVYVWPHTFGELSVDDVLPLGQQVLHGLTFPAPRDAEKMLAVNYGPNWRVPDPSFKFPWAEAEAKFAPLIAEYRHNRRWDRLKGLLIPWAR